MRLTSLQNPRVKEVIRLRDRRHRDQSGLFLIEGFREIQRALQNGIHPLTLFTCPPLFLGSNEPALIERCRAAGAQILECTEPVFCKMAYRDRPEGLLAVARQFHRRLEELPLPSNPLLLAVEGVEKPGNLGTLIRSADAAGADAVLVADPRTDLFNPNVVRASTGILFALPVVVTDSATLLSWLRRQKIALLAASPHATLDMYDADLTRPVAIAVGAEQYGLSELWMREADRTVRIPMRGQADSLNVAQAATLLLYEALRQRRASAMPNGCSS